jgi:PAS domain S-box-containing protein
VTADELTRRIRALLDIARRPEGGVDLGVALTDVARIIGEALEFGAVAVNLERPAFGDLEVVAVYGVEEVAALLGTTSTKESWGQLLDPRFEVGGVCVVRDDAVDWHAIRNVVTFPVRRVEGPDAWHPEDAILAPMRGADGELLGVISVDLPLSGRHPPQWQLAVLAAAAQAAGLSVESAARAREERRLRHALELLAELSASMQESRTTREILSAVCDGIHAALGFERVSAQILEPASGTFVPLASAGWLAGDPALRLELTPAELAALLEAPPLRGGCCLLEPGRMKELAPGAARRHVPRRIGTTERAWRGHWLLVPLLGHDQRLLGFLWADDPVDSLLPSEDRLRILRMFADQAARALESAEHLAALARRSEELSALHDTTLSLVEQLDASEILQTIIDRACDVVSASQGFLHLLAEGRTDVLRMEVGLGPMAAHKGFEVPYGQGLAGRVWATGRPLAVADYSRWQGRLHLASDEATGPMAAVPLWHLGEITGVLGVMRGRSGTPFDEDDIGLLERFGRLASLALEKRRLYAELAAELAERRETEDALRQSRELYRRVVENSSELISLVDRNGRFVYASPAFATVLAVDPEALVGTSAAAFAHPDDVEPLQRLGLWRQGTPRSFSVRARRTDGRWLHIEVTTSPILGEDGEVEMTVVTGRDVTEQRRIESERQMLEEELRQAQRMEAIGRLAGGIAHDFNNILTGIIGYAELALDRLRSRQGGASDDIEEIRKAALRAGALTRQLLAFSRKQVLDLRVVDLNAVVSDTVGMLGPLLGERVTLDLRLSDDVLPVRADASQMGQVLMNLVINARDAMPEGGVIGITTGIVRVGPRRRRRTSPQPGPVRLVVTDTGIGMDEETLSRAFEPFFTTKPIAEGTGLGLSTVHGIVHQLEGEIRVQSAPGKGTTFEILLPTAEKTLDGAGERFGGESSGSGRVLLVEDEELVRALARRSLERAGYRVRIASSAEEALELVRANHNAYDALVTDVVMPGMSGPELARALDDSGRPLPVLFVSGYTADHLGELPRDAAFLAKPFRPGELVEKLRTLLDERSAARARGAA